MSRRRFFTIPASTLRKSEAIYRQRKADKRRRPVALKPVYSTWGASK